MMEGSVSLFVDEQGHAGKCSIYNERTVMEDGQMDDVALGLLQRMMEILLHSHEKKKILVFLKFSCHCSVCRKKNAGGKVI